MAKRYNLGNVSMFPIGGVIPFAGQVAPTGYLMCNGGEVSRTEYSDLFDIIGTTYGEGNGSTTFNLPDLRDKFPQGASGINTVGTVKNAGLPNITGSFYSYDYYLSSPSGAFTKTIKNENSNATTSNIYNAPYSTFSINASKSSSIYGNSNTVQPPAVCMNYIIRAL